MKLAHVCFFVLMAAAAPCFLTGCSSSEPAVVENAAMSEQEMADYEAEMDATEPIER
ncbi:hypothetical protein K227x_24020 [Rubripirellula lacrimiformis]|uniref:Secreted protein n=1 Tax=Rubripirellula lacrimiformis TaxID=1930273 RepID=A0A517NA58_9BACT|nr:hypothetical protein [Rubripirellula lacrimiformis]QDT04016.1 hypothetical protein K227x_24020 [Rubripirellula lacrimiformis]